MLGWRLIWSCLHVIPESRGALASAFDRGFFWDAIRNNGAGYGWPVHPPFDPPLAVMRDARTVRGHPPC